MAVSVRDLAHRCGAIRVLVFGCAFCVSRHRRKVPRATNDGVVGAAVSHFIAVAVFGARRAQSSDRRLAAPLRVLFALRGTAEHSADTAATASAFARRCVDARALAVLAAVSVSVFRDGPSMHIFADFGQSRVRRRFFVPFRTRAVADGAAPIQRTFVCLFAAAHFGDGAAVAKDGGYRSVWCAVFGGCGQAQSDKVRLCVERTVDGVCAVLDVQLRFAPQTSPRLGYFCTQSHL